MNDETTGIIASVRHICSADLPTTVEGLKSAVGVCMSLRVPLLEARVASQKELADVRHRMRHPKDLKEFTDWDRNIILEGQVSEYMANYELLRGMEDLLKERVAILDSLITVSSLSN